MKIPPELDVKIRTVKLMTGVGLSELVVLALEGYLQNLARERRAAMNAVIAAADSPAAAVEATFDLGDFHALEELAATAGGGRAATSAW